MKKRRLHWLLCLIMMFGMMIGATMSAKAATKTITWDEDVLKNVAVGYIPGEDDVILSKSFTNNDGITAAWAGGIGYLYGEVEDEKFLCWGALFSKDSCLKFTSTVGKIKNITITLVETSGRALISALNSSIPNWSATLLGTKEGVRVFTGPVKWSGTPAVSVDLSGKGLNSFRPGGEVRLFLKDISKITFTVDATVTGVSLNKSSTSLAVGGTETLTATVAPSYATDPSVTWSSSNTGVATVDSNGKVTGVAPGTATITVTTTDGSKTATCAVTVEAEEEETDTFVPIKKVKHKADKIILKWGTVTGAEGYDIYAAFCGREMPNKPTMSVAGTKATLTKAYNVDGNSKITNDCIKYIIKAYKTVNGAKVYISKSNVNHTVGPKHNKYSDAKKITTKKSKYTLKVGKKASLNAKATTYNGKKQVIHSATMKYESSDKSVATVSGNGKIKAVGVGTCKIYVVSACGLTKTVKVTVK